MSCPLHSASDTPDPPTTTIVLLLLIPQHTACSVSRRTTYSVLHITVYPNSCIRPFPHLWGGAVFSFAHNKVLSPIPHSHWYNHPLIDPFTDPHIHLSVSLIERAQRNILCVCDECSIERELQTQSVFLLSVFLSSPCYAFLSTHYCCTSFFSNWYNRPISTFSSPRILSIHVLQNVKILILFHISKASIFLTSHFSKTHNEWVLHILHFLVWSMDVISDPHTYPDPRCIRPSVIISPVCCSVNVVQFTASVFVFLCHHVLLSPFPASRACTSPRVHRASRSDNWVNVMTSIRRIRVITFT